LTAASWAAWCKLVAGATAAALGKKLESFCRPRNRYAQ
jgi:hypothetical protein